MTSSESSETELAEIKDRATALGFDGIIEIADDVTLDLLLGLPRTHKVHPLVYLLRARDTGGDGVLKIARNTSVALKHLKTQEDPPWAVWIDSRINKILSPLDFTAASSALGELRAAASVASILNAVPVREDSAKTPDFVVRGSPDVSIEVFTKHLHGGSATQLQSFLNDNSTVGARKFAGGTIAIREHVVSPFGAARAGESVAENVASKIAQVKSGALQAMAGKPAVLWLDFQDEDMWGMQPRHCQPHEVFHEDTAWSSGLWHGLYGSKDFPMLEQDGSWPFAVHRQRFPGLFSQSPSWSLAVLSFADGNVLCENPEPTHPLPSPLIADFRRLPNFDATNSWLSVNGRAVSDQVSAAREKIEMMVKAEEDRWHDG